jgi:hypothetical protein
MEAAAKKVGMGAAHDVCKSMHAPLRRGSVLVPRAIWDGKRKDVQGSATHATSLSLCCFAGCQGSASCRPCIKEQQGCSQRAAAGRGAGGCSR